MLIQNLRDAKLAPLGILHNMQIRSAIMKISFFGHNFIICQDRSEKLMSTPRFRGSGNMMTQFLKLIEAHLHKKCSFAYILYAN